MLVAAAMAGAIATYALVERRNAWKTADGCDEARRGDSSGNGGLGGDGESGKLGRKRTRPIVERTLKGDHVTRAMCERVLELGDAAVNAGNHPFAAVLYHTETGKVLVECVNMVNQQVSHRARVNNRIKRLMPIRQKSHASSQTGNC